MYSYALIMKENIQIDFFNRQKNLEEYTIKLLQSGKQIFLDQIKETPSLAEDFVRLYTILDSRLDKGEYYKEVEMIF